MSGPYFNSLFNPFDNSITHPKLLDGRIERTAGIRLRQLGTIDCPLDGSPVYIVLFPGFSNVLAWSSSAGDFAATVFTSHFDDGGARNLINKIRKISAGLKLTLANTPDQNEGYWEAIRVPTAGTLSTDLINFQLTSTFASLENLFSDAPNDATFITGNIRDIHKYLFKINPKTTDIEYTTNMTAQHADAYDAVVIKVYPRTDASIPTRLRFECVSADEVSYKQGTMLSRLQTFSRRLTNFEDMLDKIKFKKPAMLF